MYRILEQACRPLRSDLIRFVEGLIRSASPGSDGERTAQKTQEMFEQLGYDLTLRDDVGNVVGVLVGSKDGPTLLLETHVDIAQPGKGASRESDRQPARSGNNCFRGRAIAHNAALAAQVLGGYVLDKSPLPFRGNLVVAATFADCNGWGAGTDHLVRETLTKLGLKPALAILGEPTGLDLVHGGPGRAEYLCRIPECNERAVPLLSRHFGDSVTNGLSISETQRGASAAESTVTVACRIPPDSNVEECKGWIRRRVQSAAGTNGEEKVNVEVRHRRQRLLTGRTADVLCATEPWAVDRSDPLVLRVREALSAAHWNSLQLKKWSTEHWNLGAAGSVLVRRHQVPALCFGPGDARLVYSSNESVGRNAVYKATQGFAILAHAILGSPRPARIAA